MERTHHPDRDVAEPRKCPACGAPLADTERECAVCRHDGIDPQEYAELFWDEV